MPDIKLNYKVLKWNYDDPSPTIHSVHSNLHSADKEVSELNNDYQLPEGVHYSLDHYGDF